MMQINSFTKVWIVPGLIVVLSILFILSQTSQALTPIPTPDPQPGSFGLEATKNQPPPEVAARITTPGGGASFSTSPITVGGTCPNGLLVQIYNNDVMVGSVPCENGSFSLEVSLFAGENELTAIVFDDLGQAGPVSNTVRVTYTDTSFQAFGELITLTSSFGRRSAAAGAQLTWPLQLDGGTGPYAFSIDWGDATEPQLVSQAVAGVVTIDHVYKQAGIYRVNVRVTDSNDVSAFLQLTAVSNGQVDPNAGNGESDEAATRTTVLWVPAAIALAMLLPAFWLGRRSQIVSLRNKMLKERDSFQEK